MIDPILSLAISMHSAKGVYAVMLGSGVSKASGIMTGWEITLDLIRRLAVVANEECGEDAAAWYEKRYGEATDYCKILSELGRAKGNRRDILRRYFEPDPQAGNDDKRPTLAHRRIAELVKAGYIRVILTTNFDRLMEQALEAQGIYPTVIKKRQDLLGATPIQHERCLVVKLHGDYPDSELRNTEAELSTYHREVNRFLDRVFKEHGLIICGWSAEYDHALREAMRRCATRRYAWYWTIKDGLGGRSEETMRYLDAIPVHIQDADQFFDKLAANVFSLEEIDKPHPLTAETAVARLRSLMADNDVIHIERLLSEEVQELLDKVENDKAFDLYDRLSAQELDSQLKHHLTAASVLCRLFSTGFYYRNDHDLGPWARAVANLGFPQEFSGERIHRYLMLFPAFLCFYSAGVSALTKGRYDTLYELFWNTPMDAGIGFQGRKACRIPLWWCWWLDHFRNALGDIKDRQLELRRPVKVQQLAFRFHKQLYDFVRGCTAEFIRLDERYAEYFDRFEYLAALVFTRQEELRDRSKDGNWSIDPPLGFFALRDNVSFSALPVVRFFQESAPQDADPPAYLRAFGEGFGKEDFERIRGAYNAHAEHERLRWNVHI